ncbi:hypothetical protein C1N66_05455 [Bacillus cereus]|uniref:Group-specific protein n=1 Tax=Bacillus cereus TaxID=1396 RepID=A0AB73UED1_BACCE|nr:hypothetical protein [Bacillus cereus]MDM5374160.1 hypothetical protein [Bacillus bombysepticus]OPA18142.1 hypothetical protein BHL54_03170 [Bacillus cereus]QHV07573.1 hypothetical protein C1N82_05180 [Bacillus cereus]QHV42660.1 hypothetical protein C1N66_05455 [Bacillus cereus]
MSENKKREKFEELAEKRVTETVKKMRLIGNLSNRNNYDYTEEHVKQILSTLEEELKMLRAKFSEERREKDSTFKFK